jgi:hypothetical protein
LLSLGCPCSHPWALPSLALPLLGWWGWWCWLVRVGEGCESWWGLVRLQATALEI